MVELIKMLVNLPPEVLGLGLFLAGLVIYGSFRSEWRFQMLIVVITTEKHDRKTGAIPRAAFEKYGLTSWRILP